MSSFFSFSHSTDFTIEYIADTMSSISFLEIEPLLSLSYNWNVPGCKDTVWVSRDTISNEFLCIHMNYSFEIPSLVTQTVTVEGIKMFYSHLSFSSREPRQVIEIASRYSSKLTIPSLSLFKKSKRYSANCVWSPCGKSWTFLSKNSWLDEYLHLWKILYKCWLWQSFLFFSVLFLWQAMLPNVILPSIPEFLDFTLIN